MGRHSNLRLIARLDVKMQHLIKGVHLEGWRKLGDPIERAEAYYHQGVDELLYMDVVASLYQRNNLTEIVKHVAGKVFIPITVGGGIDSRQSVSELLSVGADKVAINTAATQRPELLHEIADTYGSQATVLSIEAQKSPKGGWIAMTDNGRNHTYRDVIEWVQEAESLGVGEILVTSIDKDGTGRGYDLELLQKVSEAVSVPVIGSGGCATTAHICEAANASGVTALAMAKALHKDEMVISDAREALNRAEILTRMLEV